MTIKSCSSVILKDFISGIAITTFGFPPLLSILASRSPKVLHTDNLPGNTLYGPIIISFFALESFELLGKLVAVL